MKNIIFLLIISLAFCSCSSPANPLKPFWTSPRNELQEMVDSLNKESSETGNDKEIYNIRIVSDTLLLEYEMLKGNFYDIDRFKAAIKDKDVRDVGFGRMIAAMCVVYDSSKVERISPRKMFDIVIAEKMYLAFKFVTPYGTLKENYSSEEIIALRDKYLPSLQKEIDEYMNAHR